VLWIRGARTAPKQTSGARVRARVYTVGFQR
jgi:hypothetical protein